MKKQFLILFLAVLFIGGLSGCYDDKGNYKYKNINEVTFTILPESETGYYRFKQPANDTLVVDFTLDLSQSMAKTEDNLEFLWIVSKTGSSKTDTVRTKEMALKIPPQVSSSYNIYFVITDNLTDVSFYKDIVVNTVYPYMNSWFVLNGAAGDRRISAIEEPDSTSYIYTEDAYMDLGNKRRFQNATGLIYSSTLRANYREPEYLQVIEPDSIFWIYPFTMNVEKTNRDVLPSVITANNTKLAYGLDGGPAGATVLMDANHHFYFASISFSGAYYEPDLSWDLNNTYQADMLAKAQESNYMCIWDGERKKFLYYGFFGGSELTLFDEEYNDWSDKEIIWMGLDNNSDKGRIAMALVKDSNTQDYWIYHFDADGFKYTTDFIGELPVNKDSKYATTLAFEDQFFYTVDSKLYLFNVASLESFELYDAGAPITQIKFRINERQNIGENYNWFMRCLAMAVNKDSAGELHEVVLDIAGDVERSNVYTGFGPIEDFCFTFLNRLAL